MIWEIVCQRPYVGTKGEELYKKVRNGLPVRHLKGLESLDDVKINF